MFTNLLTYSLSSAVFIPPSAATQPLHSLRRPQAISSQPPCRSRHQWESHGRTDTMGGQTPWAPWTDRHHGHHGRTDTMGGQTPWAPWADRHHEHHGWTDTMGGQTPWAPWADRHHGRTYNQPPPRLVAVDGWTNPA